jgi:hypothetical protein
MALCPLSKGVVGLPATPIAAMCVPQLAQRYFCRFRASFFVRVGKRLWLNDIATLVMNGASLDFF